VEEEVEQNQGSVAIQVVVTELENIDYDEKETLLIQAVIENIDYEEKNLPEWDGPSLNGSRNWTSEEIKILLK
ncbi:2722_t:CDS:2, partial [Entrophospora sp. SA101]